MNPNDNANLSMRIFHMRIFHIVLSKSSKSLASPWTLETFSIIKINLSIQIIQTPERQLSPRKLYSHQNSLKTIHPSKDRGILRRNWVKEGEVERGTRRGCVATIWRKFFAAKGNRKVEEQARLSVGDGQPSA